MIVRELLDGSALLILQENHADVAAQFAAHWGNERFARLDPYQSVVFATVYHDSGHREMEADVPIDVEKGLPYAFRGAPPAVRRREADAVSAQWVRARDPYASLLVSMHHAGLRKGRYNTVRLWQGDRSRGSAGSGSSAPGDASPSGLKAALADLEDWQREEMASLGLAEPRARNAFWCNYRLLQAFDLLSLYFCCDGYEGDRLKEAALWGVPLSYVSDAEVEIRLIPRTANSLQFSPYPFDVSPFHLSAMARVMVPAVSGSEAEARAAYYAARRYPLAWEITD